MSGFLRLCLCTPLGGLGYHLGCSNLNISSPTSPFPRTPVYCYFCTSSNTSKADTSWQSVLLAIRESIQSKWNVPARAPFAPSPALGSAAPGIPILFAPVLGAAQASANASGAAMRWAPFAQAHQAISLFAGLDLRTHDFPATCGFARLFTSRGGRPLCPGRSYTGFAAHAHASLGARRSASKYPRMQVLPTPPGELVHVQ
ncbi:hypothetical protein K438DRAFT_1983015 [Mycena galopus ATCC 62051]|nr:hypothetical protein K438DRAFT_1983015 [Mycena galopus ATCC 62051]